MGELHEMDFGADTDAIRRWLAKRATYAGEQGDPVRGGRHRATDPSSGVDPQRLSVPNARDAGRDVLEALVAPEPPVASHWPTPPPPARTEPSIDESTADDLTEPSEPSAPGHAGAASAPWRSAASHSPYASTRQDEEERISRRSTNAVFKPRKAGLRIVTAAFVLAAALAVGTGYVASQERTTASYGLVAITALLALVLWGVRASTTFTELAVIRGQLEMIRDGRFEVIDLASPFTPVFVEGIPGRRGWRVLIERHDEPLLVIDRTMVDPVQFMQVLERVRPDLGSGAPATAAS